MKSQFPPTVSSLQILRKAAMLAGSTIPVRLLTGIVDHFDPLLGTISITCCRGVSLPVSNLTSSVVMSLGTSNEIYYVFFAIFCC